MAEKIVIEKTSHIEVKVISSSHDWEVVDKETGQKVEEGKAK